MPGSASTASRLSVRARPCRAQKSRARARSGSTARAMASRAWPADASTRLPPQRPSPTIAARIIVTLFRFDAGRPRVGGPAHDLAANEGAEFARGHRRDDHPDAGELFARRGQGEEFFAFAIKLVDDRLRRAGRR